MLPYLQYGAEAAGLPAEAAPYIQSVLDCLKGETTPEDALFYEAPADPTPYSPPGGVGGLQGEEGVTGLPFAEQSAADQAAYEQALQVVIEAERREAEEAEARRQQEAARQQQQQVLRQQQAEQERQRQQQQQQLHLQAQMQQQQQAYYDPYSSQGGATVLQAVALWPNGLMTAVPYGTATAQGGSPPGIIPMSMTYGQQQQIHQSSGLYQQQQHQLYQQPPPPPATPAISSPPVHKHVKEEEDDVDVADLMALCGV